ncbi:hypothetical protein K438DRAFT_1770317 [Mycena galopus ATCC 62051]|nr:hypothetical protein K438DRAFT_1770317 [Mycena galopus ATCC 62051]
MVLPGLFTAEQTQGKSRINHAQCFETSLKCKPEAVLPVPSNSHDPSFSDWVSVVCLHPERMTESECSIEGFNRCPNPDVSGILVRVPAYLTNLLLGIVIMYDPQEASAAMWTQLLTIIATGLILFTSISEGKLFTAVPPCDNLFDQGAFAVITYCLVFLPYIGVAVMILVIFGDYEDGYTSKTIYGITSAPFLLRSVKEQVKMMNIDGRWSVFLIHMIYWVIWNEIRLLNTPDNIFSPSFGQVLAVFVVLQPLLQIVMMFPRAAAWFSNLAVIRFLMGRQSESVPPLWLEENVEMVYFLLESVSE